MRTRHHQLLTSVLLVAYGGISLLGHALHWLSPHDHHHRAKVAERSHGSHSHHHSGHHDHDCCEAAHDDNDESSVVATVSCVDHRHACDICAFLDQIKSQQPQIAAAVSSHPVVAALPGLPQRECFPVALTHHAPRGPPVSV